MFFSKPKTYNNRMQSDFGKRYAPASAADARRYVAGVSRFRQFKSSPLAMATNDGYLPD